MRILTRPLSVLFDAITAGRNALFDFHVLPAEREACPVISVGNLTVGGNGKTPLTVAIVQELCARGYQPFVVTRGYGGSVRGPVQVQPNDEPSTVGDEPLLLLQKTGCPVVVSRRRVSGVAFALRNKLGNVAILDDGFQHRWLARDLDLVCVSCGSDRDVDLFSEGQLLPGGRFRESRDRGLRRASAVVWVNRSAATEDFDARVGRLDPLLPHGTQSFRATLEVEGLFSLETGAAANIQHAIAFAGIAQPEGFFSTLVSRGIHIAERCVFPDHHLFSVADLAQIRSVNAGLPLICTEKDAVKVQGIDSKGVYVLRTKLRIEPSDTFSRMMVATIEKAMMKLPTRKAFAS